MKNTILLIPRAFARRLVEKASGEPGRRLFERAKSLHSPVCLREAKHHERCARLWALFALAGLGTLNFQGTTALAQNTAFTYQGRLNDGGVPANGNYDMTFALFNGPIIGGLVAGPITNTAIAVNNGLFTTTLNFGGAPWNGQSLWLQIGVRSSGGGSAFTILGPPLQPLTPAPYAVFAGNVVLANGAVDTPQLAAGAVTSAKVANGTLQPVDLDLGSFGTTFWKVGGNAGTSTDFIGTTDDQPFDVRVNNVRVMRYRLNPDSLNIYTNSPNVIGGSPVNTTGTTNVVGATIAGGGGVFSGVGIITPQPNKVTASFGTVGGGLDNVVSGYGAIVAGGLYNSANGLAAAVGGGNNNVASGPYATVPGGEANNASGDYSFAAGYHASADHEGSFVWADYKQAAFHSFTNNQFAVRCTGGAKFVTAIDSSGAQTAGVRLQSGDTAWSSISDRNAKKNFSLVDAKAILEKLAAMPVQSWNYKWEPDTETPNLGPMAQDFKAAFYPGRDDKSISTLEFDGVELAAIQGLNQKVEDRTQRSEIRSQNSESRIQKLEAENAELKQKNDSLEKRLNALEKIIHNQKSN